jgi:protein-L-isoaspartate O-methyltransferase
MMNATYSPEDNKLRLYSLTRLDAETYQRVRAAGFIWAPKQDLFVAPMWTPAREDLLLELCGEIGDEDTSLVERAEERAERFEEYSEHRAEDAERAHKTVKSITDFIPMGQPILVGHHSERHARKDAERIENGMRKAIRMWETSQYWEYRAKGAIRAAKYKELPGVRARRIKGLEADIRRLKAEYTPDPRTKPIMQHAWNETNPDAERIEHVWCGQGRGGSWVPTRALPKIQARNGRWIAHIENRLIYERAMLEESGGTAADKFNIEIGGRVLVRGEWVIVLKINKTSGKINSLTTNRRYVSKVGIEEVKDYKAPEGDTANKVRAVMKLAPLCNYPGEDTLEITQAQWNAIYTDHKATKNVKGTETQGAHRVKHIMSFKARQLGYDKPTKQWDMVQVYITDAKRKDPPAAPEPTERPKLPAPIEADNRPVYKAPEPTVYDAMKETLKEGIKTVVAPQLFPTPPEIAERMVELAEIEPGMCVLEPSAGTGNLIKAVLDTVDTEVLAYEINQNLCGQIERVFPSYKCQVRQRDFLEVTDYQGYYPRIIMNPPFENAVDIKHINHALAMLKPGGRLVALCANGPRQREAFMSIADYWEDLPAGSFKEQGMGVNVALMVINKEAVFNE